MQTALAKRVKFGELEIELKKVNLETYYQLFPYTSKLLLSTALGSVSDSFSSLKKEDIQAIQGHIIKNCSVIKEDGERRDLTLFDLSDNLADNFFLIFVFFEFNFSVFSTAPKIVVYLGAALEEKAKV